MKGGETSEQDLKSKELLGINKSNGWTVRKASGYLGSGLWAPNEDSPKPFSLLAALLLHLLACLT